MKISNEESLEKERYAAKLLKDEPELSAAKINRKLEEVYGSPLRTNRLYQLVHEVRGAPKKTVSAGRPGKRQEQLPQVIYFFNGETPEMLLVRTFETLRKAGATNLAVVRASDNGVMINRR